MDDLMRDVDRAGGLTAEIVVERRGCALNDWVIIEPMRTPQSSDEVQDVGGEKNGLYEHLYRVVLDDTVHLMPSGSVVAIVRQLAVPLQKDGALMAIKHAHIILVLPHEQLDTT